MKLDYDQFESSVQNFLRSPEAEEFYENSGHSVIFGIVMMPVVMLTGLLLICTIIYIKRGFSLLSGAMHFVFSGELFHDQGRILREHPEKLTPLIVASIIIGPTGKGLVLGTLSKETQQDFELLRRKASELTRLYLTGSVSGPDGPMVALLKDDTYVHRRRRRIPASHSEGHDLLLFDVDIDRSQVLHLEPTLGWLAYVVSTEAPYKNDQTKDNIAQIPWNVAGVALYD